MARKSASTAASRRRVTRGAEGPKKSMPTGRQWYMKVNPKDKSADFPAGSESFRTFKTKPRSAGWKPVTNKAQAQRLSELSTKLNTGKRRPVKKFNY